MRVESIVVQAQTQQHDINRHHHTALCTAEAMHLAAKCWMAMHLLLVVLATPHSAAGGQVEGQLPCPRVFSMGSSGIAVRSNTHMQTEHCQLNPLARRCQAALTVCRLHLVCLPSLSFHDDPPSSQAALLQGHCHALRHTPACNHQNQSSRC